MWIKLFLRCVHTVYGYFPEGLSLKIGVFGGSFDPPHRGHLCVIRSIFQKGLFDELLLIPSGRNLEKSWRSSPLHREAMLNLLLKEAALPVSYLRTDLRQFERPNIISHTNDLLKELELENPGVSFWFVIGEDLVNQIEGWHRGEELLREVSFLVVPRPFKARDSMGAVPSQMNILEDHQQVDISSTQVFEALRSGADSKDLIHESIRSYILKHGLYDCEPSLGLSPGLDPQALG